MSLTVQIRRCLQEATLDDQIRVVCNCRANRATDTEWVPSGEMPLGGLVVQINNGDAGIRRVRLTYPGALNDDGLAELARDLLDAIGPLDTYDAGKISSYKRGPSIRVWRASHPDRDLWGELSQDKERFLVAFTLSTYDTHTSVLTFRCHQHEMQTALKIVSRRLP